MDLERSQKKALESHIAEILVAGGKLASWLYQVDPFADLAACCLSPFIQTRRICAKLIQSYTRPSTP